MAAGIIQYVLNGAYVLFGPVASDSLAPLSNLFADPPVRRSSPEALKLSNMLAHHLCGPLFATPTLDKKAARTAGDAGRGEVQFLFKILVELCGSSLTFRVVN